MKGMKLEERKALVSVEVVTLCEGDGLLGLDRSDTVGHGSLGRGEDGSASDTHAEEGGTALGPHAEVLGGQSERRGVCV